MGSAMCKMCAVQKASVAPSHRILLFGLANVGKSTLVTKLKDISCEEQTLRMGQDEAKQTSNNSGIVNIETIKVPYMQAVNMTVFDIGYSDEPDKRLSWKHYYTGITAVVFVIDASDTSRMLEASQLLDSVMSDPQLAGVPVILLANKQDCEGALPIDELSDLLNLESLMDEGHECRIHGVVATIGRGVESAFANVARLSGEFSRKKWDQCIKESEAKRPNPDVLYNGFPKSNNVLSSVL